MTMDQKDSLLGVVGAVYRWRKQIIGVSFAVAVLTAGVSLLLPNYVKSTTIFYAASPDLASPEALFGKSNESMDYYGEDEDVDRIMTIAKSNELKDFLIAKYNLYEHYEIDSTHIKAKFKIYERLEKLYAVEKTKFDAIELSFEDKDKALATSMANDARLKIDEIGQRLIKQSQEQVLNTYNENIRIKVEELNMLIQLNMDKITLNEVKIQNLNETESKYQERKTFLENQKMVEKEKLMAELEEEVKKELEREQLKQQIRDKLLTKNTTEDLISLN